jgi:cell shape-determining protein MreC|tara:strand:- start:296 stop:457 length:162 start_codon:yes stop_codon:yes gene_type:complete
MRQGLKSMFKSKKQKQFETKMADIRKRDPFVYWSEEEWDRGKIDLPKIDKEKK